MPSLAAIPWKTHKHQRVASQLDRLRADGRIGDGRVLPPERELSELCGVSRPTLRQVMQTLEAHGRVKSHARRGRVLVADPIDQEATPRSLSQMIALVTDDKQENLSGGGAPRGYSAQLTSAVTEAAVAAGYDLLVLRLSSAESTLPAVAREGVSGVVVATSLKARDTTEKSVVARAHELGVPVVAYGFRDDSVADSSGSKLGDIVASDHRAGGYLMTRWLIEQRGCRRPVPYLRVKSSIREAERFPTWWQQRIAGYRQAMDESGLEPFAPLEVDAVFRDEAMDLSAREADARYLAGYLAPLLHLPDRPDAIVCASDYCAAVASEAVDYALDPSSPRPVVTGYDNTWAHLRKLGLIHRPPAATADKDFDAIGQALVQRLHAQLNGEEARGPQLITPRLVTFADGEPHAEHQSLSNERVWSNDGPAVSPTLQSPA
ncbi:MAG: LacI family DNA-binding transcriptional regulator [Planctomycetota bacterium]